MVFIPGDSLTTLALRPAVMYGELEWRSMGYSATGFLAKKMGSFVHIDCERGLAEHTYVGNVAWCFVCTETNLFHGKIEKKSTGSSYFIGDETPKKSVFGHMDAILTEVGLKRLSISLPLWLVVYIMYILYFLMSIVSKVYKVNLPVGISPFLSLRRVYLFKYDKAKEILGYQPLYSYEEAKLRTVNFLKSALLSSKEACKW